MNTSLKIFIRLCMGMILFGILLVVIAYCIGIATGTQINRPETYVENIEIVNQESQEIESVFISSNIGKLILKEGDSFHVEGEYLAEEELESFIENGEWRIETNFDFEWSSLSRFSHLEDSPKIPQITVTIPKNFKAEVFNINVGAGTAQLENINGNIVDIQLDAGEVTIEKLAANEGFLNVNAGSLTVKKGIVETGDIHCNIGSINFSGELTDNNNITCNAGRIDLDLKGKEEDYNYFLDCTLGQIQINENYYKKSINLENENGIKELYLTSKAGQIEMHIQEAKEIAFKKRKEDRSWNKKDYAGQIEIK